MSFTIVDAPQRSDDWFRARLGRLTGSRACDMVAQIKSGEAAARRDLRTQLVVERITHQLQENGFVNWDMVRGIELEDEARAAYEAKTGYLVRQTGFLSHDELMAGCSLDGDVDEFTGIVELKAPRSATHLSYWRLNAIPVTYRPQLLHNLWISGAQWVDFCSYDPRFPEALQLFTARLERNDFEVMAYERTVRAFLDSVDAEYAAVLGLMAAAV
jgi:predicted phage-related endonuclease